MKCWRNQFCIILGLVYKTLFEGYRQISGGNSTSQRDMMLQASLSSCSVNRPAKSSIPPPPPWNLNTDDIDSHDVAIIYR